MGLDVEIRRMEDGCTATLNDDVSPLIDVQ